MENEIKRFYIADTHFGHKNILDYDKRLWPDLAHMERDMIAAWNAKVRDCDEVYILGDLIFGNADNWRRIVPQLHGKKFLIKGNHDLRQMPEDVSRMFAEVAPYWESHDGQYHIIMSHYPMMTYKHDANSGTLMLYGHVHNTVEFKALKNAIIVLLSDLSHYASFKSLYITYISAMEPTKANQFFLRIDIIISIFLNVLTKYF